MSKHPKFHPFRPHPWHGLTAGDDAPNVVNAYIEMTPFDSVKYEIDKETGYLCLDRPQRFSSQLPTLYGFIPRTYCADRVGELALTTDEGDLDPLDICVLSERPITRAELLVSCRVIGGLHMIDHGEADDKIVAVLENDTVWADARDITDVPEVFIERLRHYFLTYKMVPGETTSNVQVDTIYGAEHAHKLVRAAMADYQDHFGE
ncbi:inorganic pyrophosphatase [Lujinxingia litoralis]|uniref:inorganic diphosphatase n=1 Tax=Lujinxingia litoralis TaxID=2211119 RepID=A0A328C948_9DELT|nr:inorganic pyrophosphatase [Lujinxingia litoralis]RAL23682.1 inorganic pyrophosphatase [Lujinxingia litoralis]